MGQAVQNPARPDWGTGRVVSVARAGAAERVTVDFPVVGRKTLLIPPGRLTTPGAEPQRESGWLDRLAGAGSDQRLRQLPESVLQVLGTPRQRLAAVLPWYVFDGSPDSLCRWARTLVGAADPLSLWSRDELEAAFSLFCRERDAQVRMLAALLKQQEGVEALREWIAQLEPELGAAVEQALRRPL